VNNPEFGTFRKDQSETLLTLSMTKIFADETQNSEIPAYLQAVPCSSIFSDSQSEEIIYYSKHTPIRNN
jgi:hypothetical protein